MRERYTYSSATDICERGRLQLQQKFTGNLCAVLLSHFQNKRVRISEQKEDRFSALYIALLFGKASKTLIFSTEIFRLMSGNTSI